MEGKNFRSFCQSRVVGGRLVEINCSPNLIEKFDSDAVLLLCFCRAFKIPEFSRHGRTMMSDLGLNLKKLSSYINNGETKLRQKLTNKAYQSEKLIIRW